MSGILHQIPKNFTNVASINLMINEVLGSNGSYIDKSKLLPALVSLFRIYTIKMDGTLVPT